MDVEALGRGLRVELAVHGASAGVAYYGFVATEMVKQGFEADPLASRLEEIIPSFFRRRVTPARAAEVLVTGVERRSPRVFAPFWLRGYAAFRGLLNPVIDWGLERDPRVQALVREADVAGRTAGREIVAAREQDSPAQPDGR